MPTRRCVSFLEPVLCTVLQGSDYYPCARFTHLIDCGCLFSGDSWRAKAERAWELQINMDAGMLIDFGGRDNWNPAERARNLAEAEA